MAPAVALQTLHHATQQATTANRQHQGIGHEAAGRGRLHHFVHQGGVAVPQQGVIKRVDEGIVGAEHALRQCVGFLPGCAMHREAGTLQCDQLAGAGRGGFRHHHVHRQAQLAPGIGHGDTGIAAGR